MYCAQMHFFRSNICFDLIPDFDLLGFWFAFVPAADLNDPNWIYLFLLKPIFLEKFGWQSVTLQSLSPFHWSLPYDMWNNLGEGFNCSINDSSNNQLFETIWLLKNKQATSKYSTNYVIVPKRTIFFNTHTLP